MIVTGLVAASLLLCAALSVRRGGTYDAGQLAMLAMGALFLGALATLEGKVLGW